MRQPVSLAALVAGLVTASTLSPHAIAWQESPSDVTLHEWGTFTAVAGEDGQAVTWLPLSGPTDLPCFVDHYRNRPFKIDLDETIAPALDYESARTHLLGRVRMETPVIYFYSSHPSTVQVDVRFPRGLMTEWYPAATVNQPPVARWLLGPPTSRAALCGPRSSFVRERRRRSRGAGTTVTITRPATRMRPRFASGMRTRSSCSTGAPSFPVPITGCGPRRRDHSCAQPRPCAACRPHPVSEHGWTDCVPDGGRSRGDERDLQPAGGTGTVEVLRGDIERLLVRAGPATARSPGAMSRRRAIRGSKGTAPLLRSSSRNRRPTRFCR